MVGDQNNFSKKSEMKTIFVLCLIATCACSPTQYAKLSMNSGGCASPSYGATSPRQAGTSASYALPSKPTAGPRLVFGGAGNKVFLGCFDCSEHDQHSILNRFGPHGGKFAKESIFNQFGPYGGQFSEFSPCNKFSQNGPILVDRSGRFYGRLTVSPYASDRVRDPEVLAFLTGLCSAQ